jgi:hypothetical protein
VDAAMSLKFGVPEPPKVHDPQLFALGVLAGLGLIMLSTFVVDKLGTAMFKRGFAKPFYLKGHRIHHSCIYFIVPSLYGLFIGLYLMGYIQPIWTLLWFKIAYTSVLVAATLAIDFLGDKYWPKIRKDVFWHHEWIYTILPAYILVFVVNIVV